MLETQAMIGRAEELGRLEQYLDAAAAGGASATVLVTGEPGIGKSTLLDATIEAASQRGMTLLRGRAVEAEMVMPFAGLHELLLGQLHLRDELASHHAHAIGVALGLEPGEQQPPFAFAVALLALIGAIADAAPAGVLIAVDDAQWLDQDSLDALLFAGRRLGNVGAVLLLAARPDPDRGLHAHGFPHLHLDRLGAADAEALIRSTAPAALSAEPLDRLLAASDGNPLALVELATHLSPDQASGADALPDLLLPSDAIDGAFRAELDRLAPAVADALTVAAADERATRGELASALELLGLDPAALAVAEAARLVTADGQRLTFRHPLLRAVAYHRAGGAQRRAAHAALAQACDGEVRRTSHLAAAADHPDEQIAAQVEAQAQAAAGRGALDAGALGYLRAAELSPDSTARARRVAAAAQLYADLGQPERVLKLIDDVRTDELNDPSVDVALRRIRAAVTMRSGKLDEGYAQLLALADELATTDRAAASELLVMAGLRDRIAGNYAQMRNIAERARQLAGDDHPIHRAFADVMLAIVLSNTGDMPAADAAVNRSFDVFDEHGYGDFSGELRSSASHTLIWLGHLDRAGRYLAAHIDEERSRDALTALICPLNVKAQLDLRRGRLGVAYTEASESLTMAVDTRQYGYFAFAAGFLADIEALMGREAECREHAAAAIAIADSVGGTALSLWSRSAIGLLELGLGRYEEAVTALEECRVLTERIGLVEPSVVQWRGNHVEALIRLGRREEAEASLQAFERGVPSTWWSWGTASRLRGMLAEDGIDDLEASVHGFDAAGAAIEAARSRLVLGERLRRTRQRRAARKPLRQALLAFEHAGAAPWAARARDELRATGESISPGGAISTDDLTPHELRVALLVADGRTNPEVAAELYMARKTVEHHLSQIYRKLGLRGRTELAKALAGEPRD